ncbi:MAG: FecR domain-containing protein, partial [Treponema sp.]|nr:FecR domain-containing protein [Treponema sp.]
MMKAAKRLYAAAVLLLCGAALFAQETGTAYIREFTGTVEIKASGAAEWSAAQTGQTLSKDTMISTGFKSTAFIALGNSTMVVRPLTRLTLQEIQNIQGNESVNINLQSGRVRADVKPPENGATSFVVQSPMVTASVRGTSFNFDGLNL